MKNIGILSFHAAHNYGSMLQNFALQQAIKSINPKFEPITINLRNSAQDDMYNIFKPFRNYTDKKRYLFKILMYPWKAEILSKQNLFEKFLQEKISLTSKVSKSSDILTLQGFDACVAGSDQIWNVTAQDFDWAYFLDFLSKKNDTLKIAYAPSMGPAPSDKIISDEDRLKMRRLIKSFDYISVREKKTAELIKIIGNLNEAPSICPDPTLLLSKEEWNVSIPTGKQLVEGKYIFLYNPYYLKDVYYQASLLSKITQLPVVVSNLSPKSIIASIHFIKKLEVGPVEFLNLIKNAEYVIGRSFHLAVFSMIFNKKFIAVNGMGDSRLGNFLSEIGMESCATNGDNLSDVLDRINVEDFKSVRNKLLELRIIGREYLNHSLSLL